MKKIIKIMALTLSILLLANVFACTKKPNKLPENGGPGTHEQEVIKTDKLMANAGSTPYKILIPSTPHENERTAANELQLFFYNATGATLIIENESGAIALENSKYFSIGGTNLLAATNEPIEFSRLSDSGFRIFTKHDNVFIAGYNSKGTLNGVYELLAVLFDFDCYGIEEYYIDKQDKAYFHEIDITEVPDIIYYASGNGISSWNPSVRNRFRAWWDGDVFINTGTYFYHNVVDFFPLEFYQTHEKWFSKNKASHMYQMCYTARGDADEFEAMTTYAAEKIIGFLEANPHLHTLTINDRDGSLPWCNCDECNSNMNKYKTHAGDAIIFNNRVAEKVKEIFDSSGSNREFRLVVMAYGLTRQAPVVFNEKTNEFEAADDLVKCHENVTVYAATYGAKFYDWNDDEYKYLLDNIKGWRVLTKDFFIWHYTADFSNYLIPTNAFNNMYAQYKTFSELNTMFLYDLGQHNVSSGTNFQSLKAYLNAKLAWNSGFDMDKLTNRFFDHYFQDAREPMYQYFIELNTYMAHLFKGTYPTDSAQLHRKYWPQETLNKWVRYIDSAYEKIEYLKTVDYKTYKILYDNINLESMGIRYLLIELYANNYSPYELLNMQEQFRTDASYLKLTRFDEHSAMSSLYTKWGI